MNATTSYLYTDVSGMSLGMRTSSNGIDTTVQRMFRDARNSAKFHQLKGNLFHRSSNLLNVEANLHGRKILSQSSAGIRSISIDAIHGSESRSEDFDRDFYPLQEHTQDRWFSVARAVLKGTPLPPVELVQVGNEYYVRDGHHRISVAKALGQKALEAEVTVLSIE